MYNIVIIFVIFSAVVLGVDSQLKCHNCTYTKTGTTETGQSSCLEKPNHSITCPDDDKSNSPNSSVYYCGTFIRTIGPNYTRIHRRCYQAKTIGEDGCRPIHLTDAENMDPDDENWMNACLCKKNNCNEAAAFGVFVLVPMIGVIITRIL